MEELNNEFKNFEAFERQFKDGDTKAGKDARKTLQRIKSISHQLRKDILAVQKAALTEVKTSTVEVKDIVKVSVTPKPKEIKIEITPPSLVPMSRPTGAMPLEASPKKKRKKPQTSSK